MRRRRTLGRPPSAAALRAVALAGWDPRQAKGGRLALEIACRVPSPARLFLPTARERHKACRRQRMKRQRNIDAAGVTNATPHRFARQGKVWVCAWQADEGGEYTINCADGPHRI